MPTKTSIIKCILLYFFTAHMEHAAASRGDESAVTQALAADPALLDRPCTEGLFASRTLLHCAAAKGHAALVKRLLALGADRDAHDKRGATALALARKQGHATVVELLEAPVLETSAPEPPAPAPPAPAPPAPAPPAPEPPAAASVRACAPPTDPHPLRSAHQPGHAPVDVPPPETSTKRSRDEAGGGGGREGEGAVEGGGAHNGESPNPIPAGSARSGSAAECIAPPPHKKSRAPAVGGGSASGGTSSVADPYQLALNGKWDALARLLDADPELLNRRCPTGLYAGRTLLQCAASKGHEASLASLAQQHMSSPISHTHDFPICHARILVPFVTRAS